MALNIKTPDTISASMSLKGQGMELNVDIVFHNHTQDAFEAAIMRTNEDPKAWMQDILKFMVKEWSIGTADDEGFAEFIQRFPANVADIIAVYTEAREMKRVKN